MENSNRPRIIRDHDIIHVLLHIWSQHIENLLGSCLRFPDHSSPKIRKTELIRFEYIHVVLANDHGFTGQFKQASVIFTLYGFVIIRSTIRSAAMTIPPGEKSWANKMLSFGWAILIAIIFSLKKTHTRNPSVYFGKISACFLTISPSKGGIAPWKHALRSKPIQPRHSKCQKNPCTLWVCLLQIISTWSYSFIFFDWEIYERYNWILQHSIILMLIYMIFHWRPPFPGAKTIQRMVSGAKTMPPKKHVWNHAHEVFLQVYDSDGFGSLGSITKKLTLLRALFWPKIPPW